MDMMKVLKKVRKSPDGRTLELDNLARANSDGIYTLKDIQKMDFNQMLDYVAELTGTKSKPYPEKVKELMDKLISYVYNYDDSDFEASREVFLHGLIFDLKMEIEHTEKEMTKYRNYNNPKYVLRQGMVIAYKNQIKMLSFIINSYKKGVS
jgi:hypothetical protein